MGKNIIIAALIGVLAGAVFHLYEYHDLIHKAQLLMLKSSSDRAVENAKIEALFSRAMRDIHDLVYICYDNGVPVYRDKNECFRILRPEDLDLPPKTAEKPGLLTQR